MGGWAAPDAVENRKVFVSVRSGTTNEPLGSPKEAELRDYQLRKQNAMVL
jgi:hypothetical protein